MNKVILITGVSSGIGESVCKTFLEVGCKVYGISRTKPVFNSPLFTWIKADLYKENSFDFIYQSISEDKIDLLVNNAGTHIEEHTLNVTQENFHKIFDLNFIAPVFMSKVVQKKLQKGCIINISSTSDRFVEQGSALYSASKAALNIYFDTFALENKNIKVIHILPDYVDTPLQHKLSDKSKDFDWEECIKPEDVAGIIKDLFSGKYKLKSRTRLIIINTKSIDDTKDPEKLWFYNVDTKKLSQLK